VLCDFSFGCMPLIPRMFCFFPFWLFTPDVDVIAVDTFHASSPPERATQLCCGIFPLLVSKQATPRD
jgi:hypothetical protein